MKISDLSERYLSYMIEQSFLIPLSALIDFSLGVKSRLLDFFVAYNISFINGLNPIFTTRTGLLNLLTLFLVSYLYYSFETLTNFGVGSNIFKLQFVPKYEFTRNRFTSILLVRNLIKSFFISNMINSLFLFKNTKLLQSLFDKKYNLVSAKKESNKTRNEYKGLLIQYVAGSLVLFYSMFLIYMVIYTYITPLPSLTSTGHSSNVQPSDVLKMFETIFSNNLSLDLNEYMVGGLSVFFGTFISIFTSNLNETQILSSLNIANGPGSFVKYVLPQFFPETLGYVFGIAFAMVLADILISFVQSLIRNQGSELFFSRTKNLLYISGYYFLFSIVLLCIGALIESHIGVLNI